MAPRKTRSATLARVRENQRRCRARKRDYVTKLETQLDACRAAGIRPDIEAYKDTAQQLIDENRKLRDLLDQAGVSRTCIEAHIREDLDLQDSFGNSNGTDGQASSYEEISSSNGLQSAQAAELTPDDEGTSPSPSFNELLNAPFLSLSEGFGLIDFTTRSIPSVDLPPESPAATGIRPADPSMAIACPCTPLLPDISDNLSAWSLPPLSLIPGDLGIVKTARKDCGTTLCIVAYEMIHQQNKKAFDMLEIGILLWNGFVREDGNDEGCKVENKVLFGVLDYISG